MLVVQSCLTICDFMDCNPPGLSVHGILQAVILRSVAILFTRRSSQPRNRTWVSCIAGRFFIDWAMREKYLHPILMYIYYQLNFRLRSLDNNAMYKLNCRFSYFLPLRWEHGQQSHVTSNKFGINLAVLKGDREVPGEEKGDNKYKKSYLFYN